MLGPSLRMKVPGSPWGTLLQILILPVLQNIVKNSLHHVTYLPAKFKDVTFKCI